MAKLDPKQCIQIRRKWRRWLKRIGDDLGNLLTSNDVFKELRRIVGLNKQIQSPALLHVWISDNFASSVASGVRRLTDRSNKAISLHRLIKDISLHREAISRQCYVLTYPKWMREQGLADRDFDNYARKGEKLLSPPRLQRDLAKLKRDTARIKVFVDKYVAHCDLDQKRYKIPTFKDIDTTLQDLDDLFCRYYMLLTRGGLNTRKPALQYDWKEPLRHVWLPEDYGRQIELKVKAALEGMQNTV